MFHWTKSFIKLQAGYLEIPLLCPHVLVRLLSCCFAKKKLDRNLKKSSSETCEKVFLIQRRETSNAA